MDCSLDDVDFCFNYCRSIYYLNHKTCDNLNLCDVIIIWSLVYNLHQLINKMKVQTTMCDIKCFYALKIKVRNRALGNCKKIGYYISSLVL